MKVALLLLPAVMFFSSALIAQDDVQPAPSSHPTPQSSENNLAEPRHEDSPFLSRYGKANQLKFIIEPDLDFGSVNRQLTVGVAPTVGHKLWKGLYAGAGMIYTYSVVKNLPITELNGQVYFASAYRQTYGGGVYLHYNIWKGLYVRVRFDVLHRYIEDLANATVVANITTGKTEVKIPVIKMNIPDMPIGIGYNILIKKKLFLPIKLSYNILYPFLNKQYTVYPDGWIIKLGIFNIF